MLLDIPLRWSAELAHHFYPIGVLDPAMACNVYFKFKVLFLSTKKEW